MSEVIHGKNVAIEMFVTDSWYPILCATDGTYTRSPEFVEKTGPNSGLFREFAVRIEEWNMTVSGLTKINNDASLTFFYMLQTGVRRTIQQVRMTFVDDDANSYQITGNILIGQSTISGPVADFAQCSIELKGTGAFDMDIISNPVSTDYDLFSDWWIVPNGQNYISGASQGESPGSPVPYTPYTLLATDIPVEVDWEGTEFDLVSGTPAAGAREAKFTTSPVRVTFPADLLSDGSQRVFVEFKKAI